jgi:hypothetical protein
MLLQCGSERGASADGLAPGAGWLPPETLESLTELNELCLALLAEQGAARGAAGSPLLRQIAELWRALDDGARRRAAACPYLLLDAGFADPARWRALRVPHVGDGARAGYPPFFTVPGATEVARLVFTFAWHLARSQTSAARLLLGMPAMSTALIGQYTLRQIHTLAESRPEWLRPRWAARTQVWRELLLAAASGEGVILERARLRGLTLLAAEARAMPAPPRAERMTAP